MKRVIIKRTMMDYPEELRTNDTTLILQRGRKMGTESKKRRFLSDSIEMYSYKEKNPYMSIKDIAKVFNVTVKTARRRLKKALEINCKNRGNNNENR